MYDWKARQTRNENLFADGGTEYLQFIDDGLQQIETDRVFTGFLNFLGKALGAVNRWQLSDAEKEAIRESTKFCIADGARLYLHSHRDSATYLGRLDFVGKSLICNTFAKVPGSSDCEHACQLIGDLLDVPPDARENSLAMYANAFDKWPHACRTGLIRIAQALPGMLHTGHGRFATQSLTNIGSGVSKLLLSPDEEIAASQRQPESDIAAQRSARTALESLFAEFHRCLDSATSRPEPQHMANMASTASKLSSDPVIGMQAVALTKKILAQACANRGTDLWLADTQHVSTLGMAALRLRHHATSLENAGNAALVTIMGNFHERIHAEALGRNKLWLFTMTMVGGGIIHDAWRNRARQLETTVNSGLDSQCRQQAKAMLADLLPAIRSLLEPGPGTADARDRKRAVENLKFKDLECLGSAVIPLRFDADLRSHAKALIRRVLILGKERLDTEPGSLPANSVAGLAFVASRMWKEPGWKQWVAGFIGAAASRLRGRVDELGTSKLECLLPACLTGRVMNNRERGSAVVALTDQVCNKMLGRIGDLDLLQHIDMAHAGSRLMECAPWSDTGQIVLRAICLPVLTKMTSASASVGGANLALLVRSLLKLQDDKESGMSASRVVRTGIDLIGARLQDSRHALTEHDLCSIAQLLNVMLDDPRWKSVAQDLSVPVMELYRDKINAFPDEVVGYGLSTMSQLSVKLLGDEDLKKHAEATHLAVTRFVVPRLVEKSMSIDELYLPSIGNFLTKLDHAETASLGVGMAQRALDDTGFIRRTEPASLWYLMNIFSRTYQMILKKRDRASQKTLWEANVHLTDEILARRLLAGADVFKLANCLYSANQMNMLELISSKLARPCLDRVNVLLAEDPTLRHSRLNGLGYLCAGMFPFIRTRPLYPYRAEMLHLMIERIQPVIERKLRMLLDDPAQQRMRQDDYTVHRPTVTVVQVLGFYLTAIAHWTNANVPGIRAVVMEAKQKHVNAWLTGVYEEVREMLANDPSEKSWNMIAQLEAMMDASLEDDDLLNTMPVDIVGAFMRKTLDTLMADLQPTIFDADGEFAGIRARGEAGPPPEGAGMTTIRYFRFNSLPLEVNYVPRVEYRYTALGRLTGSNMEIKLVAVPHKLSKLMLGRMIKIDGEWHRIDAFPPSKKETERPADLMKPPTERDADVAKKQGKNGYFLAMRMADAKPGSDFENLIGKLMPSMQSRAYWRQLLMPAPPTNVKGLTPYDTVLEGPVRIARIPDGKPGEAYPLKLKNGIALRPWDGGCFITESLAKKMGWLEKAKAQYAAGTLRPKGGDQPSANLPPQATQFYEGRPEVVEEFAANLEEYINDMTERGEDFQGDEVFRALTSSLVRGYNITAFASSDGKLHLPKAKSAKIDEAPDATVLIGRPPFDSERSLLPLPPARVATSGQGDPTAQFLDTCWAFQYRMVVEYGGFKGVALIIPDELIEQKWHDEGVQMFIPDGDEKTRHDWIDARHRSPDIDIQTETVILMLSDILSPGSVGAVAPEDQSTLGGDCDGDLDTVLPPQLREFAELVVDTLMKSDRAREAARQFAEQRRAANAEADTVALGEAAQADVGTAASSSKELKPTKLWTSAWTTLESREGMLQLVLHWCCSPAIIAGRKDVTEKGTLFQKQYEALDPEWQKQLAQRISFDLYEGLRPGVFKTIRSVLYDRDGDTENTRPRQQRLRQAVDEIKTAYLGTDHPVAREVMAELVHSLADWARQHAMPVDDWPRLPLQRGKRQREDPDGSLDELFPGKRAETDGKPDAVRKVEAWLDVLPRPLFDKRTSPSYVAGDPCLTLTEFHTEAIKAGTDGNKAPDKVLLYEIANRRLNRIYRATGVGRVEMPVGKGLSRRMGECKFDPVKAAEKAAPTRHLAARTFIRNLDILERTGRLPTGQENVQRPPAMDVSSRPKEVRRKPDFYRELNELTEPELQRAARNEPIVTALLAGAIANISGAHEVDTKNRLKGDIELKNKIDRIMQRDEVGPEEALNDVDDVLRYAIVLRSAGFVANQRRIVEGLHRQGITMESRDNTFSSGTLHQGIRVGLLLDLQRQQQYQRFEIQFHTEASHALKARHRKTYNRIHHPDTPESVREELTATMLNERKRANQVAGSETIADIRKNTAGPATGTSAPPAAPRQRATQSTDSPDSPSLIVDAEQSKASGKRSLDSMTRHAHDIAARMREAEAFITPMIEGVATKVGGHLEDLDERFKSVQSIENKLNRHAAKGWAGAIAKVNDGLRYTMVLDYTQFTSRVESAFEEIARAGASIEDVLVTYEDGQVYKAVHVTVQCRGIDVELQFHTPESHAVKLATYGNYVVLRDPAQALTPTERATLRQQSIDAFNMVPHPDGVGRLDLALARRKAGASTTPPMASRTATGTGVVTPSSPGRTVHPTRPTRPTPLMNRGAPTASIRPDTQTSSSSSSRIPARGRASERSNMEATTVSTAGLLQNRAMAGRKRLRSPNHDPAVAQARGPAIAIPAGANRQHHRQPGNASSTLLFTPLSTPPTSSNAIPVSNRRGMGQSGTAGGDNQSRTSQGSADTEAHAQMPPSRRRRLSDGG